MEEAVGRHITQVAGELKVSLTKSNIRGQKMAFVQIGER